MANGLTKYQRIFFDGEIDGSNIIDVLTAYMSTIESNFTACQQRLDIYNSVDLASLVTDSGRTFNEKRTPNPLRTCVQLKAGITLNSPVLLQTFNENEGIKNDLETIKKKLEFLNAHKIDIDTFMDMEACAVAFSYTFADKDKTKSVKSGRLSPNNTAYIQSNEIGNPVILTIYRAVVSKVESGKIVNTTKYTCYTSTRTYIIEDIQGKLTLITPDNDLQNTALPNNPITVYERNEELVSMVDELLPTLISYMLNASNLDNDVLNKINNLLVLLGVEMSPEKIAKIFNKENNTISLPPNEEGESGTKDVKFISSTANMADMMTYKANLWKEMLEMAFLPKDASSRAETGSAVKYSGNYVLTTMMCAMVERILATPKRREIENMIAIMKARGELTSEIQSMDIKISYDHNKLLNMLEIGQVLEIFTRVGMSVDDMLDLLGISTNNVKIENGIKQTQMNKEKISLILDDTTLTFEQKLANIDVVYNGGEFVYPTETQASTIEDTQNAE